MSSVAEAIGGVKLVDLVAALVPVGDVVALDLDILAQLAVLADDAMTAHGRPHVSVSNDEIAALAHVRPRQVGRALPRLEAADLITIADRPGIGRIIDLGTLVPRSR